MISIKKHSKGNSKSDYFVAGIFHATWVLILPALLVAQCLFSDVPTLDEMIADSPFVIKKEKVQEIQDLYEIELDALLRALVPIAKQFAIAPISDYQVGGVALGESGTIYLGANVEFPNLPLHTTIHAEQFLIANARGHREEKLKALVLSAAPCGHCRQILNELAEASHLKILISESSDYSLSSLLPQSFGPPHLGVTSELMLLPKDIPSFETHRLIESKALEAAFCSYAPYSKSKSGVAIQTKEGVIYTGSYLENAAFNPSTSPLQVALVSFLIEEESYDAIEYVVLAEQKTSKISQEIPSFIFLNAIAPHATFEKILF